MATRLDHGAGKSVTEILGYENDFKEKHYPFKAMPNRANGFKVIYILILCVIL